MRSVIAWAVKRPTVVNLMMVGLALAGLLGLQQLPKESFPETTLDEVRVQVVYKGAGPKEIENGVLLKIEEAVQGVTGISQVRGEAREGVGTVRLELARGQDVARVVRDVKDQIERINTFPKDAETPRVFALTRRVPVLQFALYGKVPRGALQTKANQLKDGFLALSRVKQVDLQGTKQREIAIEINEESLRKYKLKIQDITAPPRSSARTLTSLVAC